MSYCVECGVELAPDLTSCPLCETPVVNPRHPLKQPEPAESTYSDRVEEAISRMDRGYARQLSLIAALIPILIVLLIDILDGGGAWSPYVVGAIMMVWAFVAVPLLFTFHRPYWYIVVDFLALAAFLALVAGLTGGLISWYFTLVLSLVLLIGCFTLLLLGVIRRREMRKLNRGALFCLLLALFLLLLEVLVDLSAQGAVHLGWSVYASIPLVVIAIMMVLLEHNKTLKEEIRKRLFL